MLRPASLPAPSGLFALPRPLGKGDCRTAGPRSAPAGRKTGLATRTKTKPARRSSPRFIRGRTGDLVERR